MLKTQLTVHPDALRALIPARLHGVSWIAGGYAADPHKAEDIDLWVLGSQGDRSELLNHLLKTARLVDDPADAYTEDDSFDIVGSVYVPTQEDPFKGVIKVQVLFSRIPGIQTLLASFDISTHRIAKSLASGEYVTGAGWKPTHEQPRALLFNRPERTAERLLKITSRYGFNVHPQDNVSLDAVLEEVPF